MHTSDSCGRNVRSADRRLDWQAFGSDGVLLVDPGASMSEAEDNAAGLYVVTIAVV